MSPLTSAANEMGCGLSMSEALSSLSPRSGEQVPAPDPDEQGLERVTPHEHLKILDDPAQPLLLEEAGRLFYASRDGIGCGTGRTILWKPLTQSVGG